MTGEREFAIDRDPPAHPRAVEYARAWFTRLADGFADRLEPDDQVTLAALLGEDGDGDGDGGLRRWADLRIRGSRTVTVARRPG